MLAVTEIVIVPAWRRPDFLAATLRCLLDADDPSIQYWIAIDRRWSADVVHEAQRFCERLGPRRARRLMRKHGHHGNSYNILTAYKAAVEAAPDLIHLVEEDVFVGRDYFDFHRSAHAMLWKAFCVSAARNHNLAGDPPPDASKVYTARQYQSLAVSFRPEKLAPVLQHATADYYRDPVAYCATRWPHSAIPAGNAEQDGLINRYVEANGLSVVYPWLPRAYHAGFTGYHRDGTQLVGSVEHRAACLLAMGTHQLNRHAHTHGDYQAIDRHAHPGPVSVLEQWPG